MNGPETGGPIASASTPSGAPAVQRGDVDVIFVELADAPDVHRIPRGAEGAILTFWRNETVFPPGVVAHAAVVAVAAGRPVSVRMVGGPATIAILAATGPALCQIGWDHNRERWFVFSADAGVREGDTIS